MKLSKLWIRWRRWRTAKACGPWEVFGVSATPVYTFEGDASYQCKVTVEEVRPPSSRKPRKPRKP